MAVDFLLYVTIYIKRKYKIQDALSKTNAKRNTTVHRRI